MRAFMEQRFGHDFSQVRVHADSLAAESARAVNALAYTVGRHVVFGAGQYAPHTPAGRRLLAHELAHVLQQAPTSDTLQPQLTIGSAQDPAESEADRLAEQVLGYPAPAPAAPARATATGPAVRRQPVAPQGIGEDQSRKVSLPAERRGADQVQVHVLRTFLPCPCRKVEDTRTGIFYNPDLNNLALAYRRCRGRTTVDVYGQLQSNATAFLQGQAPPAGTARVGIDVNVVGRSVGGRVVLEVLGTNESPGEGIGGRAQLVFQGGSWRVFLESQFIRRLQDLPGAGTPNELELSLGGQFGNVRVRVDMHDLLDPALRRGTGVVCIPAGGVDICPFVEAGEGRGVTGGLRLDIPLDIPEVRREECFQCFCPAPVRKYRCIEDVLPRTEELREQVPVERQEEFRYYFRLDRTSPSEDPALRAQSEANLAAVAARLRAGGTVTRIFGYASPEATERHNLELSQRRAARVRELVQQRAGADAQLPEPQGGGELLGRRPSPSPSSRLGEVITASGFRSAEDLSVLLLGEEIPREELADQFVSLFNAVPEPADRLAVFGLTPDDAIAPQVLQAVEQFLRNPRRGERPWERIFRLLRVGVVRVAHTEMIEQVQTIEHRGSLRELPEAQCRPLAARAEATGEFGPVDPSALRPASSSEEADDDCLIPPQQADRERGCVYELPPSFTRRPTAPSVAPRAF